MNNILVLFQAPFMTVFSLGYSSPLWVSWFQNVNFFVLLRVEMLFLHYANELLKFLLMRCSFVPLSFLINGWIFIPVDKCLLGFQFSWLRCCFCGHPLKPACLAVLNLNLWITRGFKISPLGDSNLFQTLFLQGDGKVGRTLGDYCFLG